MDAREIYTALFDPRGPVAEPTGDWQHVGTAQNFDEKGFSDLVRQRITSSHALVAVSRTLAQTVAIGELAPVVREYLKAGEVRIADPDLKRFMQVNPIGVARVWTA
jgi:hypothetical protein